MRHFDKPLHDLAFALANHLNLPTVFVLFQQPMRAHAQWFVGLALHQSLAQSNVVIALVNLEFAVVNVGALLAHKEFVTLPDSRQSWFDINRLALEKLYLVMRTALYALSLAQLQRGVA